MDSNDLIFAKLEHKRLRYNLIADLFLIVGVFNDYHRNDLYHTFF